MFINLKQIVSETNTAASGAKLLTFLSDKIVKRRSVLLSFFGSHLVSKPFFDASFGCLVKEFGQKKVASIVKPIGLDQLLANTMNAYFKSLHNSTKQTTHSMPYWSTDGYWESRQFIQDLSNFFTRSYGEVFYRTERGGINIPNEGKREKNITVGVLEDPAGMLKIPGGELPQTIYDRFKDIAELIGKGGDLYNLFSTSDTVWYSMHYVIPKVKLVESNGTVRYWNKDTRSYMNKK